MEKTLFSVRFYINDELVSEKTVKPGALITAPEVEPIEGYSIKQWYAVPDSVLTVVYYLPFRMVDCDVNCYAVLKPNTYTSEFYVDGKLFTTVENVFGEAFITPRSPSKDGYSFTGWSPKIPETTPAENLRFDAQFEPQKYVAALLVDGEVYKEIPYTYGQKSLSLPPIPEKEGYSGEWESYTLGIGGVTINAVYTADPHVYNVSTASMSMYYKSKEALIYKVRADEGADYKVTFKSSNPEIATVDKNGIVYGAKNGTTTITVTVKDSNGNIFKDTCTVQVQYNILQWIIVILLFGWIWY